MAKNSKDVYEASGKTNVLTFEPESLHMIDDPAHPLYDERIYLPVDEAMVLNIMDQGVLEPIIVWKDPESGKVCIVDGRQRVRHTIEANRRLLEKGEKPLLVPGVVRRGSASRVSKAMVSANEIRRPDTPLGRAKKMAAALERGDDEEDLALTFDCSVQTVRTTLALLDCTQAVQAAVEAGHVNVTQARQLAAMEPEQQRVVKLPSKNIGWDSDGEADCWNNAIERAAMLQFGNSPVIPDGSVSEALRIAINKLFDNDGWRKSYSAIACYDAHEEIERLIAAAQQHKESR